MAFRKIFFFFSIFIVNAIFANCAFAQIGYVDYRQLLLNHPLIRNFNFNDKRFSNTSSAWVVDKKEALELYDLYESGLDQEAKKIEKESLALQQIKNKEEKNSKLFMIWHRKAEIKLLKIYLDKARKTAQLEGPYLLGSATGVESLVPILKQVCSDVSIAVKSLSRKYGNIPIIDVSCLPVATCVDQQSDPSLVFANFHRLFWGNSNISSAEFRL